MLSRLRGSLRYRSLLLKPGKRTLLSLLMSCTYFPVVAWKVWLRIPSTELSVSQSLPMLLYYPTGSIIRTFVPNASNVSQKLCWRYMTFS